jgi:hypothetical protein
VQVDKAASGSLVPKVRFSILVIVRPMVLNYAIWNEKIKRKKSNKI